MDMHPDLHKEVDSTHNYKDGSDTSDSPNQWLSLVVILSAVDFFGDDGIDQSTNRVILNVERIIDEINKALECLEAALRGGGSFKVRCKPEYARKLNIWVPSISPEDLDTQGNIQYYTKTPGVEHAVEQLRLHFSDLVALVARAISYLPEANLNFHTRKNGGIEGFREECEFRGRVTLLRLLGELIELGIVLSHHAVDHQVDDSSVRSLLEGQRPISDEKGMCSIELDYPQAVGDHGKTWYKTVLLWRSGTCVPSNAMIESVVNARLPEHYRLRIRSGDDFNAHGQLIWVFEELMRVLPFPTFVECTSTATRPCMAIILYIRTMLTTSAVDLLPGWYTYHKKEAIVKVTVVCGAQPERHRTLTAAIELREQYEYDKILHFPVLLKNDEDLKNWRAPSTGVTREVLTEWINECDYLLPDRLIIPRPTLLIGNSCPLNDIKRIYEDRGGVKNALIKIDEGGQ